ncbi:D-lyxose/D-mannose family sugar isomerase [Candidatus Poribacteria bacterium]
MLTRAEYKNAQERAAEMIQNAGIVIKDVEAAEIRVADFGLSNLEVEGAQILTFFATERLSAKVIALFPGQILPEHWHPPVEDDPGKQEIIRIIDGTTYIYISGEDTLKSGTIPSGKENAYTCRHEVVMRPGDQLILEPGTKHWFQAGDDGAVMYSFSTCVRDALDGFTDPEVVRETVIVD